MTGPTDPRDAAACLALAQRQVGDVSGWDAAQWAAQLAEDGVLRGDPAVMFYRPYRSALTYLLRPGAVTARKEGDVQENYVDPAAAVEHVRDLDSEWMTQRVPAETSSGAGDHWNGEIDWGSW